MKIDALINNFIYIKEIMLKRMQEHNFSIYDLFASADKSIKYVSLKEICTVEEFVLFVFILKHAWKKKIAAIYGNCQTDFINTILLNTDKFVEEYFMLELPRVCNNQEEIGLKYWPDEIVKCFDLLIYQVVKKSNRFSEKAASEYLVNNVKGDCRLLSITNAYFDGYFPQINYFGEYNDKYTKGIIKYMDLGLFEFADNNIIKEYTKYGKIDDVIKCLKDEYYYSGNEKTVIDNLNNSFKELEKRERKCDVRILDYIKDNYKKVRLFSEPMHPSNRLIIEITDRILKCIGIENYHTNQIQQDEVLFKVNTLIYPSVKKILQLEFDVKKYYYNRLLICQEITFDEYVELFIRNCIKMS